ncbi:MAG: hypothetical protein ACYDHT_04600 [Solirubrobacteraceae bacterium]
MRSAVLTHLPGVSLPRGMPRAVTGMRARLRTGTLDRRLAAGTPPWQAPVLAARALQLTSDRRRHSLARSLDRLAELSKRPAPRAVSAVVPVCRDQVRESLPEIRRLAERLRDGAPIDARGVARLVALMSDGSGPFFVASQPASLSSALTHALRDLDVND